MNFPTSNKMVSIVFDQKNTLVSNTNIEVTVVGQTDGEPCSGLCVAVNQLNNPYGDSSTVSYNPASHTGFSPLMNGSSELALYQRGPNNNPDSTVVQAQGVDIGIYLNSSAQSQNAQNANIAITPVIAPISPWSPASNASGEIVLGFEAQLQESTFSLPGSVPFVYATLHFRLKSTGQPFQGE